jgi:multiple sugar transport system permease protein
MASAVEAAPRAIERRRPPAAARRRKRLVFIAEHSVLIALAIAFLAPLAFILVTSLMTNDQALSPALWPKPFTWNFDNVFDRAPLLRYAANTFLYAGLSTIGVVISSVPVAYALARLRWRGRNAALLLVLAMMMLPPQVTVVPLYSMFSDLHLTGTLWPVILPNFFGDAFSIFLLRQFFLTIPEEYADAARVDGCGELRVMLSVVTRLARPAIAAVALFAFLYAWNDFFLPLLYTSDNPANWPLSVGLSHFRTTHQVEWNVTMAATLLFMAPVIVLFFCAQRAFVEGVTLTGVKG